MTPSMESLSNVAKDYHSAMAPKKQGDDEHHYVVPKKQKDGSFRWEPASKHTSHSALKTLKAISRTLQNARGGDKDAREALANVRFLTKSIQAGFAVKYVKTKSHIWDGFRVLLGKKSERERVDEQAEKILGKIDEFRLGHKMDEVVAEPREVGVILQAVEEAVSTNSQKGAGKVFKAFQEALEDQVKQLAGQIQNEKDPAKVKQAKKTMEAVITTLSSRREIPTGRLINCLALIFGGKTPTDVMRAKYSDFYQQYKQKYSTFSKDQKQNPGLYAVTSTLSDAASAVLGVFGIGRKPASAPTVTPQEGTTAGFVGNATALRRKKEAEGGRGAAAPATPPTRRKLKDAVEKENGKGAPQPLANGASTFASNAGKLAQAKKGKAGK